MNHARMVAVLKYICGQSRRRRPVRSKYPSTRRLSSRTNRSLRLNFRLEDVLEPVTATGDRSVRSFECDNCVMTAPLRLPNDTFTPLVIEHEQLSGTLVELLHQRHQFAGPLFLFDLLGNEPMQQD